MKYSVTYQLVGDTTNAMYKAQFERLEEARFFWDSIAYCRKEYITSCPRP